MTDALPRYLPPAVLGVVLVLVALRQAGGVRFPIWLVMAGGAAAVVGTGAIPPLQAARAINADVMLFLFGMFVVGEALRESGYLGRLSYRMFNRTRTPAGLVAVVLGGGALLSAMLMNDTLAIVGTPLVIHLARKHALPPRPLLLALAFGVTIGSVASPIGNPQNLLIALEGGLAQPFVTFVRHLGLPTLAALGLTLALLRRLHPEAFSGGELAHLRETVRDRHLARLSRISLATAAGLTLLKVALSLAGAGEGLRLTWIALAAAFPILALSPLRWRVLRRMDWATLVFFASMFVLMESVWRTGLLQRVVGGGGTLPSVPFLLVSGVLVSQLVSNVPFVALTLPALTATGAGPRELAALAAGSTLAGNLLVLGAASNVIIIQGAEREGESLSFLEFARAGVPVTAVTVAVYWLFLTIA